MHQFIFRFYLLKYSLFFSSTLVLTSSIDVVFLLSIVTSSFICSSHTQLVPALKTPPVILYSVSKLYHFISVQLTLLLFHWVKNFQCELACHLKISVKLAPFEYHRLALYQELTHVAQRCILITCYFIFTSRIAFTLIKVHCTYHGTGLNHFQFVSVNKILPQKYQ